MKMRIFLFFLFLFSIGLSTNAQTEDNCHEVTYLDSKSEIIVAGNLKDGCTMDLDWAQKSSVACFSGTRFNEFRGNHIL